jgi:hypothetical protein
MSALGVGSVINSQWLRPLALALLLLSVGALLIRGRRRGGYGPLFLGLIAATAMYWCKFRLNYDIGAYLSGGLLVAASIWNARPKRQTADDTQCHC